MLRLINNLRMSKPRAGVQVWRFLITWLLSTGGREDSLEGICLIETFKRYWQLASSVTHFCCLHFKLNIIKMGYFETLMIHFYSIGPKSSGDISLDLDRQKIQSEAEFLRHRMFRMREDK